VYLVDTSVWIDFLNGKSTPAVKLLHQLLANEVGVGLTSLIYQEILQGTDSDARLKRFSDYFSTQTFYHLIHPVDSYLKAAKIYFNCRRSSITIRSTIDCVIAQIALENDLYLLHCDRDFRLMGTVIPELKVVEG
jgi:predicted nucleic acid-binding protein